MILSILMLLLLISMGVAAQIIARKNGYFYSESLKIFEWLGPPDNVPGAPDNGRGIDHPE
jgi:hypothetical protein